ncbi:acyl-CoA N-acyltransferase [Phlebopus sp. FC_14]|nr:acyl-CoA N-acyltransferase [Phlebopus sp. FC_14]
MNIRRAEMSDLIALQQCNLCVIPENYLMAVWSWIRFKWPEITYLAEDDTGKIVGCCLCLVEPVAKETFATYGLIYSLFVSRPYRRLGLAKGLMDAARDAIFGLYEEVRFIELSVRETNVAARTLYKDVLGYKPLRKVENEYGNEDGWRMRLLRSDQTEESVAEYLAKEERLWRKVQKRKQKESEQKEQKPEEIDDLPEMYEEGLEEQQRNRARRHWERISAVFRDAWATVHHVGELATRELRRTTSMP